VLTQLLEDPETVAIGQGHVDEHKVGTVELGDRHRLSDSARYRDAPSSLLE
jgi:hypothetical protein